jgi:hypothetical protein
MPGPLTNKHKTDTPARVISDRKNSRYIFMASSIFSMQISFLSLNSLESYS